MLSRLTILLFFCFAPAFSQDPAATKVELLLVRAEAALINQNYSRAVSIVQPLLDNLQLDTVDMILLAHQILGAAHCENGHQQQAVEHFQALLHFSSQEKNPYLRSKACQHLFREIKDPQKLQIALKEDSPNLRGPAWKNYLPLGLAQFHQKRDRTAWLFLSSQALSASSLVVFYTLFEKEKNSDGTFSNPDRANFYRSMNWVSLAVLTGSIVVGLIDGHRHRKLSNRDHKVLSQSLQISF